MSDITRTDPGFTIEVTEDLTKVLTVTDVGLRGRPGIVWRGTFNASVDYYQGDAVHYNNSTYIATGFVPASATTPNVSAGFDPLALSLSSAGEISVTSHNNMPAGTVQAALEYIEDKQFSQATTPSAGSTNEGDLWFDTTNNQIKFYRNGVWEIVVSVDAIGDDTGYDSISMNGGFF